MSLKFQSLDHMLTFDRLERQPEKNMNIEEMKRPHNKSQIHNFIWFQKSYRKTD